MTESALGEIESLGPAACVACLGIRVLGRDATLCGRKACELRDRVFARFVEKNRPVRARPRKEGIE